MPHLGLASLRSRFIVRGAFVLLVLAVLAMAVVLLQEERQRSLQAYEDGFARSLDSIAARLRHPTGQLALLNRQTQTQVDAAGIAPLLLPFGAIDFDDQSKAQQAVEMAGCALQYPDGSQLCVAIGSNPFAGGFVYLVARLRAPLLTPRQPGELDLEGVDRAIVTLNVRGQTTRWLAPYEQGAESAAPQSAGAARSRGVGRLAGFLDTGFVQGELPLPSLARPEREFRAWVWQARNCAANSAADAADCPRNTTVSIRLPVETWRDALFNNGAAQTRPVWPPADLQQVRLRLQFLRAGRSEPLFDSAQPGARAAFSLNEVRESLAPGEVLRISSPAWPVPLSVQGPEASEVPAPWLLRLIALLPLERAGGLSNTAPLEPPRRTTQVRTATADYALELTGNPRAADLALAATAQRMLWFLAAMLGAIALAWLAIELGFLRRVARLTQRAAAVGYNVQDATQISGEPVAQRLARLDLSDMRGSDEIGILAGTLNDLLARVKDDLRREQIRAQQERDMWHAVGHEIMSPLQSLMVLHGDERDTSHRYVQRMQQAVRVLYGTASPSEAIEAANLAIGTLDLDAFCQHVAANAHFAGVADVRYTPLGRNLTVRADEFSLEDVVTHILRNAQRFRRPDSVIVLDLRVDEALATLCIRNDGPQIAPERIDTIFEYGVSHGARAADLAIDVAAQGGAAADRTSSTATSAHRGQGLFVVKTYMAKMGGTVTARNLPDGVEFALSLKRLDG